MSRGPIREEWRQVVGFPDYEVSDLGRVRSRKGGRWGTVGPPRVLKASAQNNGYPRVTLNGSTYRLVHRLVLEAFVGPRPPGMEAAHRNGVSTDNRVSNLAWKTPQANTDDKKIHGTHQFGERASQSKLTSADVQRARDLRAQGATYAEIASVIGVSKGAVGHIVRGTTWREGQSENTQ